ncbi:hypothetical protein UFOVP222_14 [uncultured Caudovirales phage]|uniref:Uncharacterized protein n=1 Tax=uncultured Caudovirales phage TaxID=2100421 RepID=A0A6J5TAZ2_9CAUD|nr:hypothetical protein UFOVP108_9 [uncultured Caudovirales phage]CAB5218986.1 hypothetical protein UFOVP222_14 [uncultured Caudovirales phage]
MSEGRATLRVVREKDNHMSEYKVTGIDTNDKAFSIVVKAPYGHKAMAYASYRLGIRIKSGMAMKLSHYKN